MAYKVQDEINACLELKLWIPSVFQARTARHPFGSKADRNGLDAG